MHRSVMRTFLIKHLCPGANAQTNGSSGIVYQHEQPCRSIHATGSDCFGQDTQRKPEP